MQGALAILPRENWLTDHKAINPGSWIKKGNLAMFTTCFLVKRRQKSYNNQQNVPAAYNEIMIFILKKTIASSDD